MIRVSLVDEMAMVSSLVRELGLGAIEPTVLKAAHHTTLFISPLKIVARVQSAERLPAAHLRAGRELAVARDLVV